MSNLSAIQNRPLYDLNSMNSTAGWELQSAQAINGDGEIAGWGTFNGVAQSFVLVPTDLGYKPSSVTYTPPTQSTPGSFSFQVRGGNPLFGVLVALSPDLGTWSQSTLTYPTVDQNGNASFSDSIPFGTPKRFYWLAIPSSPLIWAKQSPAFIVRNAIAGYQMVSNPLNSRDNRVCSLFNATPDGTIVYKWNPSTSQYMINSYNFGAWDDYGMALQPGEGAILRLPSNWNLVLLGNVIRGTQLQNLPAAQAITSAALPLAGDPVASMEFPVELGDIVYQMVAGQSYYYNQYTWTTSGWSPQSPALNLGVGESFWSSKAKSAEWSLGFYIDLIQWGQ